MVEWSRDVEFSNQIHLSIDGMIGISFNLVTGSYLKVCLVLQRERNDINLYKFRLMKCLSTLSPLYLLQATAVTVACILTYIGANPHYMVFSKTNTMGSTQFYWWI